MISLLALASGPALAADVSIAAFADTSVGLSPVPIGWSAYPAGVLVGFNGNGKDRLGLLDFDLTQVPEGGMITAASLDLQVNQVGGAGVSFDVHVAGQAWVEGTEVPSNDGGIGGADQASTKRASAGVNWIGGNDGVPGAIIGSGTVSSTGAASITITDTAVLQDMRDGVIPSNGFVLVPSSGGSGDLVRFDSKEGAGAATLEVEFTPPPGMDAVAAIDDMVTIINAEIPGFMDAAGPLSRRPSTIYNLLRPGLQNLVDDECRFDLSVDGYAAGLYNGTAGTFTGTWSNGAVSGSVDNGLIDGGAKTFSGDFDGVNFGQGAAGEFTNQTIVADYNDDNGYMFGLAIRSAGTQGVYLTVHGTCTGVGSYEQAMNDWYKGPPAFPVP